MVSIPRIHCHSAFKHYEMFHCNQSSGYGNSVFNTTYNFNGGTMCGGGFWGGLFGGLGMGLGAGLMNFLGGGLFGGGMFGGGFPMMNMWGGFPIMNMWNMNNHRTDGAGGRETNTIEKDNKDTTLIGDYSEKIDNLRKQKTPIEKKTLIDLYAQITKSKDEQDDIKKDADTKSYNNLLKDLEIIGKDYNLEVKDGKLTEKEVEAPEATETVEEPEAQEAQEAPEVPDTHVEKPEDLTKKNINELTPEQIKNLSKDDAITLLQNNQRINENNGEKSVKVPRNYKELLLAQKSGLKIQFCRNKSAVNNTKKSPTIQGTIIGEIEQMGDNTKIYKVKIQDKYGKYTLLFNYDEDNNNIEITEAEGAKIKFTDENNEEVEIALTKRRTGEDYKYQIGDEWAEREGESLLHE